MAHVKMLSASNIFSLQRVTTKCHILCTTIHAIILTLTIYKKTNNVNISQVILSHQASLPEFEFHVAIHLVF
jgi:hypothetical protein